MRETPQEHANRALAVWQLQRAMGIAPEDRRLPAPLNDLDSFERDLRILKEVMEHSR